MPSPFPGMDPYLEDPAFWRDFHSRFINVCSEFLADRLPGDYEARIDEQLRLVEVPEGKDRDVLPDVAVMHDPRGGRRSVGPSRGAVATLEPVAIPIPASVEVRDVWIEILHRPERSLVTVIEVLSPSNKANPGYGQYLSKRRGVKEREAHLVELDLLKGGQRIPLYRPPPRGDYYAFVTRAGREYVDVYPWSVRDRLPVIPVPLREPDPDVGLDLAAVFVTTYERGRYARALRYAAVPPAPLSEGDAAWAASIAEAMRAS